jgi:hypothetical protein
MKIVEVILESYPFGIEPSRVINSRDHSAHLFFR